MLVEMSKVRIVGLKDAFPKTLETLYTFGKLQFEDLEQKIDTEELPVKNMKLSDEDIANKERLEDDLRRLEALALEICGIGDCHAPVDAPNEYLEVPTDVLLEDTEKLLDEAEPTVARLLNELKALEEELAELEKYKPIVGKVEPIVRELLEGDVTGLDSVALLFEEKYRSTFESLEQMLQEESDERTHLATAEADDGVIPVVVVFDKRYSKTIREFLKESKTNQIKLPEDLQNVPLLDAFKQMEEREAELPTQIGEARFAIADYANAKIGIIGAAKDAVCDRILEMETLSMFGETEYTFLIEGYLPTRDLPELVETVGELGRSVVMEERSIGPKDYADVPVAIENKENLTGFQRALGFWGVPQYGSMDPTAILSISFPFIFGMIVGDAGYGLLILLFCWFLRKKFPEKRAVYQLTGVLIPAGIATIIFGIFYFEFFGNLAHVYIPGLNQIHPIHFGDAFSLPFLRTESSMMTTLLFMALGFGIIDVLIGLVLGIVNGKKMGHKKHMFEKGGIMLILISAILIVVNMMMPQVTAILGSTGAAVFQYVAYLLLAIGFVFALFGGGIMGAVETLESVAHAASYIRIMAVGLVGALLADAANELAFETMPNIGGVVIAIVLHLLNFAIIVFSPSIHALRLNFLEFFGKFFERGSKEYKPFVRAGKGGRS